MVRLRNSHVVDFTVELEFLLDLLALGVNDSRFLVTHFLVLFDFFVLASYSLSEHFVHALAAVDVAEHDLLLVSFYVGFVHFASLLIDRFHSLNVLVSASQVHVFVSLVFFTADFDHVGELRVSLCARDLPLDVHLLILETLQPIFNQLSLHTRSRY